VTKQTLIELALSEQMKERQEMEKKLQKLAKTMDHLERARRENESPLIEEAWAKRLDEERIHYEEEQLVRSFTVCFYIFHPHP
jgi:translation initiation factor 3 subunit A